MDSEEQERLKLSMLLIEDLAMLAPPATWSPELKATIKRLLGVEPEKGEPGKETRG